MQGLVLATCDRAWGPSSVAPEWVHLLPDGKMTGRDGRSFELADAMGLVLAFQSSGIDLPIDYEHQNDKPEARLSGPVPAAGWIKELKADETGLWGRVEWTATAREMISRKEYRYLSPSFLFHPKTRQIVRLKGAGLVHNPNLHLTALASQETDMPPETANPKTPAKPDPSFADFAAQLAKLLGLPADAEPQELIAKLAARLTTEPDPAKYMPVTAVQEMLSVRRAENAEVVEGRAREKVRAAVNSGYITRGMQDWALALCRSDEASFDQFLTGVGPVFTHFGQPSPVSGSAPDRFSRAAQSETETEAAICAQLGLKPGTLASS